MKNTIVLLVLVGMFKAGESAITAWSKPTIATATGSGTLTEKINNGITTTDTTGVTITAISGHTDGVSAYAKLSQVPVSPSLDIDASTGDVTVSSGTIDYSNVKSFTLVVSANDADGTASTATVTLSVNVAPLFPSYSVSPCIVDGAVAGTDLIDLTATDANSDKITYAIEAAGNTGSDFTIIKDTGVVKVATGKTLNMATTSSYTLVITATDDSSTPLVTSATVTATVSTTCLNADSSTPATISSTGSGAAALAVTLMTVFSALMVSLQ